MVRVFLDTNHWINLARAEYKRQDGERYVDVLEAAKRAVESRTAVFPLSFLHVMEVGKCGNAERRQRLARVMAELSRGIVIAPASQIAKRELGRELSVTFAESDREESEFDDCCVFGRGADFAFGVVSAEKPFPTDPVGWTLLLSDYKPEERGPAVASLDSLSSLYANRRTAARASMLRFNADVQMRRRAYFGWLTLAHQPILQEGLLRLNKTLADFLQLGTTNLVSFWERIPTALVECELSVQADIQHDRLASPNDWRDVVSLAAAIPYCDVVVTENFWTDLAQRANLSHRFGTTVLCDLCDLTRHLQEPSDRVTA